ncbi:DUF3993 domain-containing protein [Peribacillus saganii]|uniref:DUF3993 domain-containing protein n=1 Tax=Peribacillus saganii TaxID=2303992 RepID=UPI001313F5A0|nr:DUF3993 domain-containing protein [Peribacillus saganii]
MKTFIISLVVASLLFISFGMRAGAEGIHNDRVFSKLDEAFRVQLSLSDEVRSWEDIEGMLDPYFTKSFISRFMDENIIKFDGGYAVPGSDFACCYIPYFSYNDKTKVIQDENSEKLYVQENFEKVENGPVSAASHFETITLNKENGSWKIDDISYNTKEIAGEFNIQPGSALTNTEKIEEPDKNENFYFIDFLVSPRKTMIGFGLSAAALQAEMVKSFHLNSEEMWTGGPSFLF